MNYSDNQEILTFFNKSKNKIGQIGGLLANEVENEEVSFITYSLSNLLESLNSPYLDWSEEDVLRIIHYWNNRAELNNLPFMQITDYYVNITGGSSVDLGNIENTIKDIIAKTPHNSLAQIQGGNQTERYHLTKAQRDWVDCQRGLTPCPQLVDFSVSLGVTSNGTLWNNLYHELGTSVTLSQLQGGIVYGNDKQALSYQYKKNGVLLGTLINNPANNSQPNGYNDSAVVNSDTTYLFTATLASGTKSDTKNIIFKQPMYYGITRQGTNQDLNQLVINGTKDVRDKGDMNLSFTIPSGNTLQSYLESVTPFFLFPLEWGQFTRAINNTFNFANDWQFTTVQMPLADGTSRSALLAIYKTQIEGVTSFNFGW